MAKGFQTLTEALKGKTMFGLGITCRNVNDGFIEGMRMINDYGRPQPSRYGDVLAVDGPVTVIYDRPHERVLFNEKRDCNPFFHFMEGLWMLAGRNDVEFVAHYAKRMREFSDDGHILHGAYGYRWRRHYWLEGEYEVDQLVLLVDMIKEDPTTRRAVLTMWDPVVDLLPRTDGKTPKDLPCNTQIYFRVRKEKSQTLLDMTVCNRSNDIIWGLFGANAVHMSMLHEYMAAMTGLGLGKYVQFTNNFHAYERVYRPLLENLGSCEKLGVMPYDPYKYPSKLRPYQMVTDPNTWNSDLTTFMLNEGRKQTTIYSNPFFHEVAQPISIAWEHYKKKEHRKAIEALERCGAEDWALACQLWVQRRAYKPMMGGK